MKEEALIKAARRLLERIQLDPRNYPGKGRELSVDTVKKITVSLPPWMVERLESIGDAKSHHVQRALKLYFLLLDKGE